MIKFKNITKKYDNKVVLDDVSFEVEEGKTLAVIGFSGSGKSTTLKIISGLVEQDSGEVVVDTDNMAMVFQYSALFDSLDIYENVSFAFHERTEFKGKYTEDEIKEIVDEYRFFISIRAIWRDAKEG